jgi:hypothetical protein
VIVDVTVLRCGILLARKLDYRNVSSFLHFLTRSPSDVMENCVGRSIVVTTSGEATVGGVLANSISAYG